MKIKIAFKNGFKKIEINRKKAIRERCLNCSGWQTKSVARCEFIDCALYPFRSGKGKQVAKLRSKSIKDYCLWCMAGSNSEVSKCPSPDCSLFPYRKSAIDRSSEIKSIPKLGHIETVLEDKIEN
jgi:hypothetical protein